MSPAARNGRPITTTKVRGNVHLLPNADAHLHLEAAREQRQSLTASATKPSPMTSRRIPR